ncbi:MAG: hypothetical protein NZ570_05290 [Candidatus Caldarchaeum sp.]|nr:hypothetical protein [Candidatus Caldarchaeum sp.]MDW8360193.1 hypothetical protein [Candidatus Caldarchaeum sp.]
MELDVAVVGGGPVGLIAAREAARRGLRTTVFEEDLVIGRPERCAGLYSIDGVRSLGLPVDGPYVQNKVKGAVFVSPSGKSFVVDSGRKIALVCNRERLDQFIAEQAVDAGAELCVGERVVEAKLADDHVWIKSSSIEARAKHLISAEGRPAYTAKQIIQDYKLEPWLPIIQYQIANHRQSPDMVYLYFREYLNEFFGYLVPVDEKVGKFGVAASKNTNFLASKLLAELFPNAKLLGVSSSSIYLGKPLRKPRIGPLMLVGDVAGQTKATTGGGVITGGLAAVAAAKHAAGEGEYENLVKPLLKELYRTYLLRRLVRAVRPKTLDALFQAITESKFYIELGKVGDMDKHGSTAFKAVRSRAAFRLAAYFVKNLLGV